MYLELAQRYLGKARVASGTTRHYFANLCQVCLAKQGATPRDIGTTQQELSTLSAKPDKGKRKKGSASSGEANAGEQCRQYLQQCRQANGTRRQYFANLCLATLARYNLKASEIGTSESELQDLQKDGFLQSAANYLAQARLSAGTKRKCYADLCLEYLEKSRSSPMAIGSSPAELTEMSR